MQLTIRSFKVQMLAVALTGVMLLSGYSCGTGAAQPSWVTTAVDALPVLITGLGALKNLEPTGDPSLDALITAVSTNGSADLVVIQNAYLSYEQNATTENEQAIIAAINALNTNLNAILTAAHIKNTALLAKIQVAVQVVEEAVNLYEALIPSLLAQHHSDAIKSGEFNVTPLMTEPPTPASLRKIWNDKVAAGDSRITIK